MNRPLFVVTSILAVACSVPVSSSPEGPDSGSDAGQPVQKDSSNDAAAPQDSGDAAAAQTIADAAAPQIADDAAAPDAAFVDAAPILLTTSDAGDVSFDVVSPAVCTARSGYLFDCAFHPTTIESTSPADAGPTESVFTVVMSGNCASQYPLALALSAAGAPDVLFHLEDKTAVVRRTDSGAIASVSIADGSPWTGVAAYDESCRIAVSVAMNVAAAP